MNCREATRLISDAQERPLATNERLKLQVHVLLCSGCRNFSAHIPFLRKAMRAYCDRLDDVLEQASPGDGTPSP